MDIDYNLALNQIDSIKNLFSYVRELKRELQPILELEDDLRAFKKKVETIEKLEDDLEACLSKSRELTEKNKDLSIAYNKLSRENSDLREKYKNASERNDRLSKLNKKLPGTTNEDKERYMDFIVGNVIPWLEKVSHGKALKVIKAYFIKNIDKEETVEETGGKESLERFVVEVLENSDNSIDIYSKMELLYLYYLSGTRVERRGEVVDILLMERGEEREEKIRGLGEGYERAKEIYEWYRDRVGEVEHPRRDMREEEREYNYILFRYASAGA